MAEPAEDVADVAVHPSLVEWIQRAARASFLSLEPEDAKFYLGLGLVRPANGVVVDLETYEPTGQVLYVLTRRALRIAFPMGVPVTRYICTVCGKEGGGRMSRGADCTWYPRKHPRGGPPCPGCREPAREVIRKRKP